jgi:hypothetical protein
MGEIIFLREWYESKRASILETYARTDSPEFRLRLANQLSKLESRWISINKHQSKTMISYGNSS